MEFHVNQENIRINETVFNGVLEQSIELDYMLPDYCPNIFKILKSNVSVQIVSQQMSGTKLTIDGVSIIKMLYVSEETNKLRQLEQKQAFTKTVELKEDCSDGYVTLSAKCDYVNCRAVNSRRLDIRGAVSIKTVVVKPKSKSLLCDCDCLQLHRKELEICEDKLYVIKDFTVREELEVGHGKPPVQDIINYEAYADSQDYKLLANKIICKGEILLHTLYLCSSNPDKPEIIEHSIPISQIVDFEGINEDYQCSITFEVSKYDIDMQIEDDGECHSFIAELGIRAICEASKNKRVQLIDDCYSTGYETEKTEEKLKMERLNQVVQETSIVKQTIRLDQSELNFIYDVMYDVNNISWSVRANRLVVSCNLLLSVLAVNRDNIPVCMEQTVPCEIELDTGIAEGDLSFDPAVQVHSIVYNILSVEELEFRIEMRIHGMLYEFFYISAITQVNLQEDAVKRRDDNCALRLYFADPGESIWEIAKRYNTSVNAILEENSIEKEFVDSRGMLLIPIVD